MDRRFLRKVEARTLFGRLHGRSNKGSMRTRAKQICSIVPSELHIHTGKEGYDGYVIVI
jgi:hypothetical protein